MQSFAENPIAPPGGWGQQKPPLGVPINWNHPLANGLWNRWVMNEGTGTQLCDAAGRSNGVAFGSPRWLGDGIQFNGSSYYDVGTLNPFAQLVSQGVTLIFWLSEAATSTQGLFGMSDAANQWFTVYLNYSAVGDVLFNLRDYNRQLIRVVATDPNLCDGKKHCLAIVCNTKQRTVQIYIDGVAKVGTTVYAESAVTFKDFILHCYLGHINGSGYYKFNGILYDAAIWKYAMTPGQVQWITTAPYCMFASGDSNMFDEDNLFRIHSEGRRGSRGVL
jgi:hypothetical protein